MMTVSPSAAVPRAERRCDGLHVDVVMNRVTSTARPRARSCGHQRVHAQLHRGDRGLGGVQSCDDRGERRRQTLLHCVQVCLRQTGGQRGDCVGDLLVHPRLGHAGRGSRSRSTFDPTGAVVDP